MAILVAVVVNEDGYSEILSAAEGMKEDKVSWVSFFQWLRGRGLDGVKLIVCDKCLGMREAVGEVQMPALRAIKLKEAIQKIEDGVEETLAYADFPSEHWIRIRTNNVIERLNRKIRRRTRVVGWKLGFYAGLCSSAPYGQHMVGEQEMHEHEAP